MLQERAPVVVGVDGSPRGVDAVEWAAEEAALRGVALRVVRDARPLLRAAEASLLVVGSDGLQAAARARCPVVVIRSQPPRESGRAEIVVGVDAHDPAEAALRFAFATAGRRGAALRAVHAWNPPERLGTVALDDAERIYLGEPERQLLTEALKIWRKKYPEVPVLEQTVATGAAEALIHAASDATLLVIGRRATAAHPDHLGPVAHAVLQHAASPVAVVPEPETLPLRPLRSPRSG